MFKTLAALGVAVFVTAACAGGAKHQGRAGITDVKATFYEEGHLEKITFIDGKEKANVSISVNLTDGTLTYSASNVLAFEGQQIRGDVEAAIAEQWPELADSASDILTSLITKVIVP